MLKRFQDLSHLLCALACLGSACASTQKPVEKQVLLGAPVEAMTAEGKVRGVVTEKGMNVFLGVPYAAPVAGLDRFLPPKAAAKRAGVFDASQYGPACEQTVASIPKWMLTDAGEVTLYEMTDLEGFNAEEKSADCLRLNIWTSSLSAKEEEVKASATSLPASAPTSMPASAPASSEDSKLAQSKGMPVIVHLHGGGLTSGSGKHKAQEGALLAKEGVVVVTINYRLGSIGFLAGDGLFEGDLLKGNRGMMDTVQALKWIHNNIQNFGGDPNNITLMGQSGGGTNVWAVLSSPSAKGLVKRAIIMSGPINHVSIDDHKKVTKALLEKWDVNLGDEKALAALSKERAISTDSTTMLIGSGDKYGALSRTYFPNTAAYGTAFMPDDVFTSIEKGLLDDIDILVGNCDDDAKASIIMVPLPNAWAIDIWNGYMGGLIADSDEGFEAMTQKYIETLSDVSKTRAKEQLQTDALYRLRSLRAAALHSQRKSAGKTFAYQFNFKSPTYPEDIGAMHGLDLIFATGNIFKFPQVLGIKNDTPEAAIQNLSNQMLKAWANFAKRGSPTTDTLEWPEYESTERKTMVFDKKSEAVSDPRGDLRKLWK